ncbi:MAG: 16S rRNA (cytosine(967)-C(5))-methyltransferase RsmB, partial [Clostridia bacterium]|nr:16S rRNA (cytosine(967)-C(5))-methyltransferase RsmB [Clostridia bacterium]
MNSREIILKAIYNIEERGEYFNSALDNAISYAEVIDRGFITEVIYGVIKNK